MFTLKDYLELPELKDAWILTKQVSITDIKISGVSVQESPVEDFITENELVLTTAMNCIYSEQMLLSFVKEIIVSQASALIICFKPDDWQIPAAVIEAANRMSFPIIRVPWECRFSELTKAALDGIRRDENAQHLIYDTLQKDLLKAFLNEEALEFAATCISDTFQASVMIYDRFYKMKTSHLRFSEDDLVNGLATTSEIKSNSSLFGYIETVRPASSATDINTDLLENCLTMPLSLWFNKEDTINITRLKVKNNFVVELAKCDSSDLDQLLLQGQNLGFTLNIPYTAMLFCAIPKNSYNLYALPMHTSKMHSIEEMILDECQKRELPVLVTFYDNHFLIYAPLDNLADINAFINRLEFLILPDYPEYDFMWGIGEVPPQKLDFSRQYTKASLALEKCITSRPASHRLTYSESRITGLVFQTTDNAHLKKQAKSILDPLSGGSKSDNSLELLNTLKTYIQCNYNASLTARQLHLHRQSMLYRLEKIQQLTGMDLSSHDDLFLLEFYMRLLSKY